MSDRQYKLIDFGDGRKLESIAGRLIDRPCRAALHTHRRAPNLWTQAASKFDADRKRWTHHQPWPEGLAVDCGKFLMPVRPTPFGHIGLFPEQTDNWQWLGQTMPWHGDDANQASSKSALNLFAYTGGSTIALALAGYRVAHVDAAKPSVQAARQAARLNHCDDAPIRYLVDDAAKFVARELRRQNRYETIVLDPPSYGHAPTGKAWRIERDLWPLLSGCLKLLPQHGFRLLMTGHSAVVDQDDITRFLRDSSTNGGFIRSTGLRIESGRSQLIDQYGRSLDAGFYVRAQSPGV